MSFTPEHILIVGPIGAGKSFVADRVGEQLDLPVIHLDSIMLTDEGTPKTKEVFVADATEYFSRPELSSGWVADGTTLGSIRDVVWEPAELIGYVRPNFVLNVARLAQRRLTHDTRGGQNDHPFMEQYRRMRTTRPGDIEKLDKTTAEFRAKGVSVIQRASSGGLLKSILKHTSD